MVRSFDSMKFALLLAVFLVYLVMASQFESLLHPLVIMFTIPLGLIGSTLGLLATGTTISVVVLIGLIMLAGIVVNNAIVLVDYINHLRRTEGMEKFACRAARRRGALPADPNDDLNHRPRAIAHGYRAGRRGRDPRAYGHYRHRRAFAIHPANPSAHSRGLYPTGSQRLGVLVMSLSKFSLNRPVTTLMVTLCALVVGFVALDRLPMEQFPSISSSGITAPSPVQQLLSRRDRALVVTLPLEQTLGTLNNIDRISSSSGRNRGEVRVDFKAGHRHGFGQYGDARKARPSPRPPSLGCRSRQPAAAGSPYQRPIVYANLAWLGDGGPPPRRDPKGH